MSKNDGAEDRVVVAGICGSLRPGSYTRRALALALEGAASSGADTRLIDLNEYQLAFCDGNTDATHYPPDVTRLRGDVRSAHGLILATPEYHGGVSGVLKNALDLMGFDEFEGKMIGLLGISGGGLGAINGLNSLRNVGRALHAWVLPDQVAIPHAREAFEDDRFRDASVAKRVNNLGRQVARFAYLHTSQKAQEFMRAWEEAPENPGAA